MISAIITSIMSVVLYNGLSNYVAKNKLKSDLSVLNFNFFAYLVCIVAFGILLITDTISLYTVLLGLIFGIANFLSVHYKFLALNIGPMHLTLLFTTSSMIIPTISGVFFGEKFSLLKLLTVFILIVFLYLSFEKGNSTKANGKWFIYSFLSFVFSGAIGILQKIHQASAHKEESAGFLFITFVCSLVICLIRSRGHFDSSVLNGKILFFCFVCGVCTFAMHFINLKLSGILPSQLFFPLINGSCIVLSSLISVLLFKEKLSKRQAIGLVGGIISLIAICLVP